MADETLYGCVNWNTGKVEFEQDPNCNYYGCMEWSGLHAGQVAVTVDTDECDDIYYGCVNWTTGKFEVRIPDYCCGEQNSTDCPCNAFDDDPDCNSAYQPKFIQVHFSGITPCSGCYHSTGRCGEDLWNWTKCFSGSYTLGSVILEHTGGCGYGKQVEMNNFKGDVNKWCGECAGWSGKWGYDKISVGLEITGFGGDQQQVVLQATAIDGWQENYSSELGCITGGQHSLANMPLFSATFFPEDVSLDDNCFIYSTNSKDNTEDKPCCYGSWSEPEFMNTNAWDGTGEATFWTPSGAGVVNPNVCT